MICLVFAAAAASFISSMSESVVFTIFVSDMVWRLISFLLTESVFLPLIKR